MPFIEMKPAKATTEQKEKLVEGFTSVASEALGMPASAFYVLIQENEPENWGVEGKLLPKFMAERK